MIKYKSVIEMLLNSIFYFQLNFEEGEGQEFWDGDDISFEVISFLN